MTEEEKTKDEERIRHEIAELLASGLETHVFPRADTHEQVIEIVGSLQREGLELKDLLVIAGFTDYPVEHGGLEQPCETCMYYLVHRKYCELPELDVPVEPQWSCRLWRI